MSPVSLAERLAGDCRPSSGRACPPPAGRPWSTRPRRPGWAPGADGQVVPVRPVPPGWGPPPRPGWGYYPPPPGPRRPALSGVTVLVLVTVLAALAAPHAHQLRGIVTAGAGALAQRGKLYRWGARGPDTFDCSGLTWAAWRAAGVAIPRTAAGQLA